MASMNDRTSLLKAATTAAPGPTVPLFTVQKTFTFSKTVVGPFTVLVVNYEGSLDGTTWFQLGTDNTLVAGATFAVDKPCLFVRANVGTFTGGTSVSVDMVCTGE
jgi:hypothetical protein